MPPGRYAPYFSDAEVVGLKDTFMAKIMETRKLANVPFIFNSAFRDPSKNKAVGGVEESAHCCGQAVDIRCEESRNRYLILAAAVTVGFRRIGIAKTFIHLDDDETKPQDVAWLYK